MRKVLIATNNKGKVERFRHLVKHVDPAIALVTPGDLGISELDIAEVGKTLEENALLKAKAYLGATDLPILANDTGFYVEGVGLIDAPKRAALQGAAEHELSKEEIAAKLLAFWKGVATERGGRVDAAWLESFVLMTPDGASKRADSRREVVLTDAEFGTAHIQMPVRALYISKTTNKPAITHTEAEELLEMRPVIEALTKLLG